MDIRKLSEREILALQYSLLEEMKQKPKETVVTATFNREPTMSAEEYIKQRFTDDNGHRETNNQYLCRLKWFELGCPKLNKFANKTNKSYKTIRAFSSRYNWQNIRTKAIELGYHNEPAKFVDNTKKEVKRDSKVYNRFRESVLKRDKVCQCCGSNEDLEVHHLFSFKSYNSLGADTKNGVALCKECHTQYHSQYGTKKNNNPVTFAQFLRDYGMSPQSTLKEEYKVKGLSESMALSEIARLEKEYAGDCPYDVLLSNLIDFDDTIDSEVVDAVVTHLKQIGQIYEPSRGYYRMVI